MQSRVSIRCTQPLGKTAAAKKHVAYAQQEICVAIYSTIRERPLVKAQKNDRIWRKKDVQYGGRNCYILQCGTITTWNSPGGSTRNVPPVSWQWIHPVAAPRSVAPESCHWMRPVTAPCNVALGWHDIMTSNSPSGSTLGRKKLKIMSIFKTADISHLGF